MAQRPPDILRITEAFQRRLRANEAAAVKRMAQGYERVSRGLVREGVQVAEEVARLRAAGEAVPTWRTVQLERYRDLITQAEAELVRLGGENAEIIAQLQREGIELGVGMAQAQVQALIPASIRISFNLLPTGALEAMAGFLEDGSPLARLLQDLGVETARKIGKLLTDGIGLGWNPRKVAKAINRQVGMDLARAMRIARTEQLRAWRQSSIQGYRDQGSLIKGYRRHAQADDRTCIACLLEDGRLYATEEDFTDHVQGRCSVIPVTRSWAELGFPDIKDTNVEWELGGDWFRRQDEDAQRRILGDPVFDAWRDGKIGLDDMKTLHRSPVWGDAWTANGLKRALEQADIRRATGG